MIQHFVFQKINLNNNKDKDKDNNGDTNGGDNDNDNDIIIEKIIQLRGSSIFPQNKNQKLKPFEHIDYSKTKNKIPPTSKHYTMDDFLNLNLRINLIIINQEKEKTTTG